MGATVSIFDRFFGYKEDGATLALDEICYSKKHGHEICVIRMVGKNIFPRMATDEILTNKHIVDSLSREDLVKITKLHMEIKQRRDSLNLIEVDRNETILFENQYKEKIRYSSKHILSDPKIQNKLQGKVAFSIGYRLGFKEGSSLAKRKNSIVSKIVEFIRIKK